MTIRPAAVYQTGGGGVIRTRKWPMVLTEKHWRGTAPLPVGRQ